MNASTGGDEHPDEQLELERLAELVFQLLLEDIRTSRLRSGEA